VIYFDALIVRIFLKDGGQTSESEEYYLTRFADHITKLRRKYMRKTRIFDSLNTPQLIDF